MAGYDNIKDKGFDTRSTDEVRAIAKKGGQASGATRRRKRSIKQLFSAIGDLPVNEPKIILQMEKMGIPKDEQTIEMAVVASAVAKAMKTENPKLLEFVLELLDKEG